MTELEIHMRNVGKLSMIIAKEMGLDDKDILFVSAAAYHHDLGKLKIPYEIVNKNGKLTVDEMNVMKQHPVLGAEILRNNKYNSIITKSVLYHHERYDGKGYPEGLKENNIPLYARIISVADSFDAMVSNRCYRQSMSLERALNELVINSGKQFDPAVVETFNLLMIKNINIYNSL